MALLASFFNVWGGAEFGRIGKADATHARSAVRRLLTVGRTLTVIQLRLEGSLSAADSRRVRSEMMTATAELSTVRNHLVDAISDWNDVHAEALYEVLSREAEPGQEQEAIR